MSCIVLAALCPSLTTLRLCGCSQVGSRARPPSHRQCGASSSHQPSPSPQPELTSAGVAFLALRCRGLTEVDLSGCAQLSTTAVDALTRYCSGLTKLAIVRRRARR